MVAAALDFIEARAFPLFGTGQNCDLFFIAFMIFFGMVRI